MLVVMTAVVSAPRGDTRCPLYVTATVKVDPHRGLSQGSLWSHPVPPTDLVFCPISCKSKSSLRWDVTWILLPMGVEAERAFNVHHRAKQSKSP